jgi:hypothetical protein
VVTAERFGEAAAALAAKSFDFSSGLTFLLAKDADRFRMGFSPNIGQQIGQRDTAGRESLQHVAQIRPDF